MTHLAPPLSQRSLKRLRSLEFHEVVLDDARVLTANPTAAQVLLPEELWSYILSFAEDIDLQTLVKVNHVFRRLASDRILWKNYLNSRNRFRIASRLFVVPQRPSRNDLVAWNILRTTPSRDISTAYVNGPTRVAHWIAQETVRKFFIHNSLQRALSVRPTWDDLAAKNVISPEDGMTNACRYSPKMAPKVIRLSKAMREDRLRQSMRSRMTMDEFSEKNLAKQHTVMKYCSYNPTLLAVQVELDKRLTSSRVHSGLAHRPSVGSLESMKVLPTGPDTALMLCPPIRPKLRFFEHLSVDCAAVGAE
ncbi:hypothetical protein HKX48_002698 [Thoreauomyces humboldtii]|nr:hypothetical protein HKX48_002698 [Thoreauomyces humboldtii]